LNCARSAANLSRCEVHPDRVNPSGFSKWLAPFMAGAMRRANRKDLAALN
jgi:hypothetical protein